MSCNKVKTWALPTFSYSALTPIVQRKYCLLYVKIFELSTGTSADGCETLHTGHICLCAVLDVWSRPRRKEVVLSNLFVRFILVMYNIGPY
jgi:hypothetical protein